MAETSKPETKKEIVEDIKASGVPEAQAKAEEKLDEKEQKPIEKKEAPAKEKTPVKSEKKKVAPKKTEKKKDLLEREYIIPLREKIRTVARYKRSKKAIRVIKEFLVKHMKIRDRNLDKVKIDKFLNEFIWKHGIKNPPHKVKVRAVKDGDIVRVESIDLTEKLKFKKLRVEKKHKAATEEGQKKADAAKSLTEKAKEQVAGKKAEVSKDKEAPKEEAEKPKDEKKPSKDTKVAAPKPTKEKPATKMKESKRPQRKALAK